MTLRRQNIVKWVTLIMGLLMFFVQLVRYTFDMLSDFKTEMIFLSVWIFLLIAPFTIPSIIRTFIDKFINKK